MSWKLILTVRKYKPFRWRLFSEQCHRVSKQGVTWVNVIYENLSDFDIVMTANLLAADYGSLNIFQYFICLCVDCWESTCSKWPWTFFVRFGFGPTIQYATPLSSSISSGKVFYVQLCQPFVQKCTRRGLNTQRMMLRCFWKCVEQCMYLHVQYMYMYTTNEHTMTRSAVIHRINRCRQDILHRLAATRTQLPPFHCATIESFRLHGNVVTGILLFHCF